MPPLALSGKRSGYERLVVEQSKASSSQSRNSDRVSFQGGDKRLHTGATKDMASP